MIFCKKVHEKEITSVKRHRTRILALVLCLLLLLPTVACNDTPTPPVEGGNTTDPTPGGDKEPEGEEEVDMTYYFEETITKEVLCNYLSRAVTISLENSFVPNASNSAHIRKFILNTGAKYICRAATCWNPSLADYETHAGQKSFITTTHRKDPDIVFEACVFECISTALSSSANAAEIAVCVVSQRVVTDLSPPGSQPRLNTAARTGTDTCSAMC